MEMAAVAHVAAFVRIVNASQTQELHEWTLASLERAFAWTRAMESLADTARKDDNEVALDAALAKSLAHAALPVMGQEERLTVSLLCCATRLVCDAVLTSAWLETHPMRSAFVARVLKTRLLLTPNDGSLRELMIDQIQTRRALTATNDMADIVRRSGKRTRVQVGSAVFDIPSMTSYTLDRRTQRLQGFARTLQANLCAANALQAVETDATYTDLLARIESQLQVARCDVVEVILWAVVLDWPEPMTDTVRTDTLGVVEKWIQSQPMRTLLSLAPWLGALFARASTTFARLYVSGLMAHLPSLDRDEWRERIGALVLQGADLNAAVEKAIGALDPFVMDAFLTI